MLILISLGPSGFQDVSGDSMGLSLTLLASTTSPLRCSHVQARGGVAAVAGAAVAAPQAAGAPIWVELRTVVTAVAAAALAPDEKRGFVCYVPGIKKEIILSAVYQKCGGENERGSHFVCQLQEVRRVISLCSPWARKTEEPFICQLSDVRRGTTLCLP